MEDDLYLSMMAFAKKVALAIDQSVKWNRVGVAVMGLEVPHAHLHLVPLHSLYDIDFKKPKLHQSPEELEQLAQQLRAAVAS